MVRGKIGRNTRHRAHSGAHTGGNFNDWTRDNRTEGLYNGHMRAEMRGTWGVPHEGCKERNEGKGMQGMTLMITPLFNIGILQSRRWPSINSGISGEWHNINTSFHKDVFRMLFLFLHRDVIHLDAAIWILARCLTLLSPLPMPLVLNLFLRFHKELTLKMAWDTKQHNQCCFVPCEIICMKNVLVIE